MINHKQPLAIKYAKRAEMLYLEGMPLDRAIETVRPQYFRELKQLNEAMRRK